MLAGPTIGDRIAKKVDGGRQPKAIREIPAKEIRMDRWQSRALIALAFAMMMVTIVGAQATKDAPPATGVAAPEEAPANAPSKPLALLEKDKNLEIDHIEIKGENP